MPHAWLLEPGQQENIKYDVSPLASLRRVNELWDDGGDTFVYLHNREHTSEPSFKVNSAAFSASRKLFSLANGNMQRKPTRGSQHPGQATFEERMQQMSLSPIAQSPMDPRNGSSRAPSSSGSRDMSDSFFELPNMDIHLCLPQPLHADLSDPAQQLPAEDVETLVAVRNVFAFLTGKPLVATAQYPSIFSIFLRIADIMQRYDFSNLDGSTLGEVAETNFKRFIEDFKLADVRSSREKTIEAVVLGERMRSWELYNEGFVHLVGKYDEVLALRSPKFHLITDITSKRMERATLDLSTRMNTVRTRLETFDFPSLFTGIANSTTSTESKVIRFKAWKAAFISMRRHVIGLYKQRYGAWPPSARSKKNDFEESGLNRILLREVYQDFSDLYDILVDRSALTTRSVEVPSHDTLESSDPEEPTPRALRRVMSEYDRSVPPVQPPIPFDTPLLPSLATTRRDFTSLDPKKQRKERMKKLRDDEINLALMQSYNRESIKATPFLQAFMSFERQSAHGKSVDEICDVRNGQWIFMYAVLQSLPLVVVDAPNVRWTKGVEYFLFEVPKGAAPWIQEGHNHGKSWYSIAGGSGVISLPADIVEHGVEGVYRRSHCWEVAQKWAGDTGDGAFASSPIQQANGDSEYEGLGNLDPPPQLLAGSGPPSRSSSPGSRSKRDSIHSGLEALPLPAGVVPAQARPMSQHDPLKSFDQILGTTERKGKKK